MSKQTYKQIDNKDSALSEVRSQANDTMQKIKFQDQKRQFDAKIEELAAQAADFYNKYGEEDWRTSLLVNFLDMSLQMKDIIEVITAFNVANEIIFHAMNLMNTSLTMSNGMMLEMANNHVNPFKQKIMMHKAVFNNRRTVKRMIEQMKTSIQMASLTAGMYADLSVSISGIMEKMNIKREKVNQKKKATGTSMTSSSGRGMSMVKSIVSGQSAAEAAAAPAPKPAQSPSASSAPAGGDSGLDGLL